MQKVLTAATLITASAIAAHAHATTALIDFGKPEYATGNAGGVQYNDIDIKASKYPGSSAPVTWFVNGGAETTAPAVLLDTANTNSGWTLSMELVGGQSNGTFASEGNYNAPSPFPAGLSAFEESALSSTSYNNRFLQTVWTFEGLDDNATYEIIVYGNGKALGTANTGFVPLIGTGGNYSSATVSTDGAVGDSSGTQYLHWTGVTSVGGVIEFRMDSDRETWLNFAAITDESFVPEPGSMALLGLGGLALLRRRRSN